MMYVASALAIIPGIGSAAGWLRHENSGSATIVLAAFPFVAALLPIVARGRAQVTLRGLAAGLLLSYALLLVTSIGFLFVPAALFMGAAALRAFLQ
jgi:hypothetical protein